MTSDRSATVAVTPPKSDDFRADIEGLRGVAVLMVVTFHAALLSGAAATLSGGFIGVDLFLVISGFLITGLLLRERERTGRISFTRFYARRVRRIAPAAIVVLLVTLPAAYALVGLMRAQATMTDGAAAALSIANIRFALTTDYFNPVSYSPFLHFWSLGVEEQFYIVWPAVMVAAAWRGSVRSVALVLAGIIVVSAVAEMAMTEQNPSWAFYMLPTRAWQLAAGGLLAIWLSSPRPLPSIVAVPSSLAAAGTLAAAALLFNSTMAYPGAAAFVPTIAAVVLIATGQAALGAGALLRTGPLRFLGKISYSLYLWHWPVLILGALALNRDAADAGSVNGNINMITANQAIALVIVSVLIATVSWALVEEPFRRGLVPLPRPGRIVGAGVAAMMIVTLGGLGLSLSAQSALASFGDRTVVLAPDLAFQAAAANLSFDSPSPETTATAEPEATTPDATTTPAPSPGFALVLTPAPTRGSSTWIGRLTPSVGAAPTDYELPFKQGCLTNTYATRPPAPGTCVYGNPQGNYTVALIGDSHASAVFPAVQAVALAHGWKLLVYLKVDCKFADMPTYNDILRRQYDECTTWNDQVLADLAASPPDLILVTMNRYFENIRLADASVTAQGQAIAREIEKLPAQSKAVLIEDYPYQLTINIPSCLAGHLDNTSVCAYPRVEGKYNSWGQREALAARTANVPLIDTERWTCPGTGRCPAIINGMIVFRDAHHLTATFAASLGPSLENALAAALRADSAAPSNDPGL